MKRIFKFIKSGFKDLGYNYYLVIYWYEGKPETGYVIIRNYTFLWILGNDRVSVCINKQDLEETLAKLN